MHTQLHAIYVYAVIFQSLYHLDVASVLEMKKDSGKLGKPSYSMVCGTDDSSDCLSYMLNEYIDAYDHEVWHHGTSGDRVVLLFDVWHPDLIPQEQQALIEMFQSARDKGWLKDHQ